MSQPVVSDPPDERRFHTPWIAFLLITAVFLFVSSQWSSANAHSGLDSQISVVASGNRLRRLLIPFLGLIGSFDLIRSRREPPALHGMLWLWIVSFLSWAALSLSWSEQLGIPVRRGVVFLAFSISALAIATRIRARDIAWLMLLSSGTFLVMSLAWELKAGRFQILGPDYRFSGTLVSNLQAINCFFVCLSAMYLADSSRRGRLLLYGVSIIGLGFVILTRSRSGFAAAVIAILAYKAVIWKGSRRVRLVYWIVLGFMVLFLLFGDTLFSTVSGGFALGRSVEESGATLNGRIPLWTECLRYWSQRPILGYGFNGFWTVERIVDVTSSQGWPIASAHSIYVDTLLELGPVGLFLFIGLVVFSMLKALRLLAVDDDIQYGFVFGFLVFFASEGLMESQFLTPNYVAYMAMVFFAHLGFSRRASMVRRLTPEQVPLRS